MRIANMTPTEQDKELRGQIETLVFARFYDVPEKQRKSIVANLLKLITADRKRVELEARIDERQMLSFHRAYGKDYQGTLELLEEANDERIAELKAQQEEV